MAKKRNVLGAIRKLLVLCDLRVLLPAGVGHPKSRVCQQIYDASDLDDARHMAVWPRLILHRRSSGMRTIRMGISKRGYQLLRTLLGRGARLFVRTAVGKMDPFSRWVDGIRERRGTNHAIVVVGNKYARIIWTLLARHEEYRPAT
jgi:transposase